MDRRRAGGAHLRWGWSDEAGLLDWPPGNHRVAGSAGRGARRSWCSGGEGHVRNRGQVGWGGRSGDGGGEGGAGGAAPGAVVAGGVAGVVAVLVLAGADHRPGGLVGGALDGGAADLERPQGPLGDLADGFLEVGGVAGVVVVAVAGFGDALQLAAGLGAHGEADRVELQVDAAAGEAAGGGAGVAAQDSSPSESDQHPFTEGRGRRSLCHE